MGVSTTHRIYNLSMWILIYSFNNKYYVWAACGRIKHGDPRFFSQVFAKNSLIKNILEEEKKFNSRTIFLGGK